MDLLQKFVQDGFVVVDIDITDSERNDLDQKLLDNPYKVGLLLEENVPELKNIFEQDSVVQALSVILGTNYVDHPWKLNIVQTTDVESGFRLRYNNTDFHREHLSDVLRKYGYGMDKKLFIEQWIPPHHCRSVFAFYLPSVTSQSGGLSTISGSQYYDDSFDGNLYQDPFRWESSKSVLICHESVYHRALRFYNTKGRNLIRYRYERIEEPSLVDSESSTWTNTLNINSYIPEYHWKWYHGESNKNLFPIVDFSEGLNKLKNSKNNRDRAECIYSLSSTENLEPLLSTIKGVNGWKDPKSVYEQSLVRALWFMNEIDLGRLIEIIKDDSTNHRFKCHLLHTIKFYGVGDDALQSIWIELMNSMTSESVRTSLYDGASVVCQSNLDAYSLLCDRLFTTQNYSSITKILFSIYRMAKFNSLELPFSVDDARLDKIKNTDTQIVKIILDFIGKRLDNA